MGRVLDGGGVRGGRRGQGAKLSGWEVDELLAMRRRGATLAEIAARYRLSERTVSRYVRRAREEGGDDR